MKKTAIDIGREYRVLNSLEILRDDFGYNPFSKKQSAHYDSDRLLTAQQTLKVGF